MNKKAILLGELEDLKRRKLELLETQRRYRSTHQLEFFQPHPKQQPFFDALLRPELRQFIFCGGNRAGKTCALVASVCSFVEHRFPWVPLPPKFIQTSLRTNPTTYTPDQKCVQKPGFTVNETHQFASDKEYREWIKEQERDKARLRFNGPLKIRIIGEDYEKSIGQVILPALDKFLRPELIASRKKNQAGVYSQFILTDGTVIDLLTYAQDSAMMEGWSGHIVAYDEPPPRAIYIANQRGLIDYNGIALFSMTPLKEPWIANELVNSTNPSIFAMTVNTRDNPHLDAKAIDEFESALSDDEKATRIGGEFLHLQGLVFKEYSKETHTIKRTEIPRNWTVYCAIDTHPRTQQALLFVAVDPKERFYVCHEVFQHGTPDQVANWIIDFHTKQHRIHTAIIEPASQVDINRGDTTFQIIERRLAEEAIPLEMGSKDLAGGILIIREALLSANGIPSLFVFNDLARVQFEFQNYVWKEWTTTSRQGARNEQNKPRDADDHLIECLRRILQHPAKWQDPAHASAMLQQANEPYRPNNRLAGY